MLLPGKARHVHHRLKRLLIDSLCGAEYNEHTIRSSKKLIVKASSTKELPLDTRSNRYISRHYSSSILLIQSKDHISTAATSRLLFERFNADQTTNSKMVIIKPSAALTDAWDREQTPYSLRTNLVEEAYEVVSAIEEGDDENLREELGDLLFKAPQGQRFKC